jgi:hypothetical protein
VCRHTLIPTFNEPFEVVVAVVDFLSCALYAETAAGDDDAVCAVSADGERRRWGGLGGIWVDLVWLGDVDPGVSGTCESM